MEEIYVIFCFVTFLIVFIQSFVVLVKSKHTSLARVWFLTSIFIGVLSWGLWGMITAEYYGQAVFYRYILNVGVIFSPLLYFKFMTLLLGVEKEKEGLFRIFVSVAVLLLFLGFIPFFREPLYTFDHNFNYWTDLSIIYISCFVFLMSLFTYSFYLAIKKYEEVPGIVKNQLRYILPFTALGVLGGLFSFWPLLIKYFPIGNLLWALATVAISFALLKEPLPSAKKVTRLIYVYLFISIFSYLFFHMVSFVNVGYFGGFYTNESLLAGFGLAFIFSLVLLPFLRYVQETGDVLFFQGKNPYRVIKNLSIKFNNTLSLKTLLKTINKEFKDILGSKEVTCVVFDPHDKGGVYKEPSTSAINIKKNSSLARLNEIKVLGRIKKEESSLKKQMQKHGFRVAVPLFFQRDLIGLILLGDKKYNQGYAEEDLDFLQAITPQVGVAIHNAYLYQKVEDLNKNLETKIRERTADIKEKNQKLKKMVDAQGEFLDIAGHQLRTPVSVIKGMLSMINEGEISKKKKEEFLHSVLQNSFKLEEIVETMLTASEVDSGNFGFDLEPIQPENVLRDVYERQKGRAKERGIKLKLSIPNKYILPVLSNKRYLNQALENMVDNAIKYTREGSVTIKLTQKKERIDIDIIDKGIGIPKNEVHRLFKKFNRAKNAVDLYGNGSGLGLFVAKKIIDAHTKDASVYVKETKLGKGTTFTITLPTVRTA